MSATNDPVPAAGQDASIVIPGIELTGPVTERLLLFLFAWSCS